MAPQWFSRLAGRLLGRPLPDVQAEEPVAGPTPTEQWLVPGIYFDSSGWRLSGTSATSMSWTQGSSTMTLAIAPRDRQMSVHLDSLRTQRRAAARATGGDIVSVDRPAAGAGDDVEVITKRRVGLGFAFEGERLVTHGDVEYTIRIEAPEQRTGMREAVLTSQLVEVGELMLGDPVEPGGVRHILNWRADPYDREFDDDALNGMSDDARLDPVFPDHPLTQIRAMFRRINASLELDGTRVPTTAPDAPGDPLAISRPPMSLAALREIYWRFGRNDLLQDHLMACLALVDPDESSTAPDVARLLLMLGQARHNAGNLEGARQVFERAHAIFAAKPSGHRRDAAVALVSLGRTFRRLERLSDAHRAVLEALAILDERNDDGLHVTLALGVLVDTLLAQDRVEDAAPFVERAQRLLSEGSAKGLAGLRELCGEPPSAVTATISVVDS